MSMYEEQATPSPYLGNAIDQRQRSLSTSHKAGTRWTPEEDDLLRNAVAICEHLSLLVLFSGTRLFPQSLDARALSFSTFPPHQTAPTRSGRRLQPASPVETTRLAARDGSTPSARPSIVVAGLHQRMSSSSSASPTSGPHGARLPSSSPDAATTNAPRGGARSSTLAIAFPSGPPKRRSSSSTRFAHKATSGTPSPACCRADPRFPAGTSTAVSAARTPSLQLRARARAAQPPLLVAQSKPRPSSIPRSEGLTACREP